MVDPPGPLATLDRAHLLETSPDCLVVLVRDKTLTVRPAVLARPEPVPGRLELDEEDVRTGLTVTEADPALSQLQPRCRSGWKMVLCSSAAYQMCQSPGPGDELMQT